MPAAGDYSNIWAVRFVYCVRKGGETSFGDDCKVSNGPEVIKQSIFKRLFEIMPSFYKTKEPSCAMAKPDAAIFNW
tara:strand:- start:170 stop:397 length:228 start_codon:yes stop_codon:yes gene_type:complete